MRPVLAGPFEDRLGIGGALHVAEGDRRAPGIGSWPRVRKSCVVDEAESTPFTVGVGEGSSRYGARRPPTLTVQSAGNETRPRPDRSPVAIADEVRRSAGRRRARPGWSDRRRRARTRRRPGRAGRRRFAWLRAVGGRPRSWSSASSSSTSSGGDRPVDHRPRPALHHRPDPHVPRLRDHVVRAATSASRAWR